MHIRIEIIVSGIEGLNKKDLDRVQEALDRRRKQLGEGAASTVLERRDHRNGVLQLEKRAYRRKDGGLTARGPYWYFHYRDKGRQRTRYIGQTDDPGAKVDELMGEDDD